MLSCRKTDDFITKKRNKMKKIVALVAVLFSVVVPVQSQASEQKALVIIDSYFDSRISNATVVCVATDLCKNVGKESKSVSDNFNHGVAMADVAQRNNPDAPLILIRAANVTSKGSVDNVNGMGLIAALKWANDNSQNISAVSFSRSISNNAKVGDCKLASTGLTTQVAKADAEIQSLISQLNAKGIPFFASTGNKSGSTVTVTYPACLVISSSVAAGGYSQSLSNADTDFTGFLPEGAYSYLSVNFGLVPQTTSSATAAVAAKWVKETSLQKGRVDLLR